MVQVLSVAAIVPLFCPISGPNLTHKHKKAFRPRVSLREGRLPEPRSSGRAYEAHTSIART